MGTYMPPFEYRVGADAGAMIPLPAEMPVLFGDCNLEVVGSSLVHWCWTGLNRFDLNTRSWSPGTKAPSGAPVPFTRLSLVSGNTLAVFGSPSHARYDLSSDTWSLLSDAGAPPASISGGLAAGNELVLFNDLASRRGGVFVYSLDVGTWRSFDIASPDGGVMSLFAGAQLGGTLVLFGQRYTGGHPDPVGGLRGQHRRWRRETDCNHGSRAQRILGQYRHQCASCRRATRGGAHAPFSERWYGTEKYGLGVQPRRGRLVGAGRRTRWCPRLAGCLHQRRHRLLFGRSTR